MSRTSLLSLLVPLLLLVACGGGGTPAKTPSANINAQGLYTGRLPSGSVLVSIVLPSDKFYAAYASSMAAPIGMMAGQGSSVNGTYSANYNNYYWSPIVRIPGAVTASYVPGMSFTGTLAEGGASGAFTANSPPASLFNFNQPPSLGDIGGDWFGAFIDGSPASFTVSADGSFSGETGGCVFSGTVTPDSSGKNFYSASVTFGDNPCLLANQRLSGIAVSYLVDNGVHRQLFLMANTEDRGALLVAQR